MIPEETFNRSNGAIVYQYELGHGYNVQVFEFCTGSREVRSHAHLNGAQLRAFLEQHESYLKSRGIPRHEAPPGTRRVG